MTPQQLIAAAMAQRETVVPIDDRLSVTIRRPAETQITGLLRRDASGLSVHAGLAEVKAYVVGWSGFSESDFMAGGSSDAATFDPALWAVWIEDHRDGIASIAQAIVDAVLDHEKRKSDIVKN